MKADSVTSLNLYVCSVCAEPQLFTDPRLHVRPIHNKQTNKQTPIQCGQGCDFTYGVRNCDHSAEEIADLRWQCGRLDVDIDNIRGGAMRDRNLVVFSGGGAHDLYHKYQCRNNKTTEQLEQTKIDMDVKFSKVVDMRTIDKQIGGEKNAKKYPCAGVQQFGGKEIFLSPFAFRRSYKLAANVFENFDSVQKCANIMRQSQKAHFYDLNGLVANYSSGSDPNNDNSKNKDSSKRVAVVDKWVDCHSITSKESKAPYSLDGVHYPLITYSAILEVILSEYANAT